MKYYGMDAETCDKYHKRNYMPFMGRFWCMICDCFRGGRMADIDHAPLTQDKDYKWQKGAALVRKLRSRNNS